MQTLPTQVPGRVQVASGGRHVVHHPTYPVPDMHGQPDLVHVPEKIIA